MRMGFTCIGPNGASAVSAFGRAPDDRGAREDARDRLFACRLRAVVSTYCIDEARVRYVNINIMIIASLCRMHSDACVIMLQVLIDRLAGACIEHENLLRVPKLLCAPELACSRIL